MSKRGYHVKADHAALTAAEEDLLAALIHEPNLSRAAERLGISAITARNRMAVIRDKIGAATTDEALRAWRTQAA